MKEQPILFSASMVRAILAGTKTQTRRIFKGHTPPDCPGDHSCRIEKGFAKFHLNGKIAMHGGEWTRCKWLPGGRLWVRETWATSIACDDRPPSDMEKPGRGYGWPVWYAADGAVNTRRSDPVPQGGPGFTTMGKCRPSIFMPRWASRLTLEITGVRVERLKDISNEDCFAEGLPADTTKGNRTWYGDLWEEIIGIEFCDWRAVLVFVKVQVLGADLAVGVDFGDELILLMRCCRLLLQ